MSTEQSDMRFLSGAMLRKRIGAAVVCGVGCALAIWIMEASSSLIRYPLFAIPFATSIVLVIGSPRAKPAQPRALIGGHVMSALAGFVLLALFGAHGWVAALAVGIGVGVMMLTDTFHPPAGINPLLIVTNNLPWTFMLVPVLAGALLLAVFAFVWHRITQPGSWPYREEA